MEGPSRASTNIDETPTRHHRVSAAGEDRPGVDGRLIVIGFRDFFFQNGERKSIDSCYDETRTPSVVHLIAALGSVEDRVFASGGIGGGGARRS